MFGSFPILSAPNTSQLSPNESLVGPIGLGGSHLVKYLGLKEKAQPSLQT